MADLLYGWWTTNGVGYLNQQHKNDNARKFAQYFTAQGWTREAICGVLGNIEIESRFDPQNIYGDLETGAYGLVQWHPPTKIINFAAARGLDYRSGNTQCARIEYEWRNNLQWQYTGVDFAEYVTMTANPEYMARTWAYHYEVADRGTWNDRATWARYYYENLRFKVFKPWLYFKLQERGRTRGNTLFIR